MQVRSLHDARHPEPATDLDIRAIRTERARLMRRFAASKPPLTRVFDIPRIVPLGDKSYALREFRLIDLAEIQAWLTEQVDHPLDGWVRGASLTTAWELSASWPPRFGTPEARALLATSGGVTFWLWIALRRCQPQIDAAEVVALAQSLTAAEWRTVQRIAWGVSARAEVVGELAPDLSLHAGTDWPDAVYRIVDHHGMTFDQVGELTLSQWAILASGGQTIEQGKSFQARLARAKALIDAEISA